jgi:hypothetical protein
LILCFLKESLFPKLGLDNGPPGPLALKKRYKSRTIAGSKAGQRSRIMKQNWLQAGLVGLTICSGTASAIAGEPIVRQFGDWKVTITPKNSTQPLAKKTSPIDERLPVIVAKPRLQDLDRTKLDVVPVSFQQPEEKPVAAPIPADVIPANNAAELPAVSNTPAPLAPAALAPSANASDVPCTNCDRPLITPRLPDPDLRPAVVMPQTAHYRDVYNSIPFIRAEYRANPSYRHDATMEFLFNQMRPTVIQRGTTNVYQYDHDAYGWGGLGGYYPYDPPYYPYGYGLRIHRSR